ncbi:adenylyl-sulfate kinase, partial [Sinorhizobium medicae]|nr:adenylyl-sulfate kinase [Sinorhizobium medicae]MDX0852787.1 adenylyl-sulfate kinase [Sinorhizobium medicae]MDX0979135.1 adenylyl-sulfate kinase [Sinorhizobium medicae]MDX1097286.1 adenylyl-sulfate kinase [Sinorhizobium medicae]MDX1140542.1 adenylyl-sulfate kinase [Sinorhizobium medicae]
IANFTGVSSPYETPENPELHIRTVGYEPTDLALAIEEFLDRRMEGK